MRIVKLGILVPHDEKMLHFQRYRLTVNVNYQNFLVYMIFKGQMSNLCRKWMPSFVLPSGDSSALLFWLKDQVQM